MIALNDALRLFQHGDVLEPRYFLLLASVRNPVREPDGDVTALLWRRVDPFHWFLRLRVRYYKTVWTSGSDALVPELPLQGDEMHALMQTEAFLLRLEAHGCWGRTLTFLRCHGPMVAIQKLTGTQTQFIYPGTGEALPSGHAAPGGRAG